LRWISLDISTNTGFAIFEDEELTHYGRFTYKVSNYKANIKSYKDFPEEYPINFMETAQKLAEKSLKIILENKCEFVIIEHPESAKQRLSQRILEWTHYALTLLLVEYKIPFKYILVKDWRNQVNCYLRHWEEHRKFNQQVKAAKRKAVPTEKGNRIAKIDGKRVGAINQKKLSIIIANQHYGLSVNDDNIADAINIGRGAWELGMLKFPILSDLVGILAA